MVLPHLNLVTFFKEQNGLKKEINKLKVISKVVSFFLNKETSRKPKMKSSQFDDVSL